MVEQLEDINGYSKLSTMDKVKYVVALKAHLDTILKDDLKTMDICEVVKHSYKKNTYKTIFLFDNSESVTIIKFKKCMLMRG